MRERNQRGMSTQDTILSAFADLVVARPYASFSVNELNSHAGVSKTQFYHHFSSKDTAAAEFVRLETEKAWEYVRGRIGLGTSSVELLVATVLEMTGYLLDTQRFRAALITANEIGRDESLRIDFFGAWRTRIVVLITAAATAGDISPDIDASRLATQMLAAWNGLRIFSETLDSPADFVGRTAEMLDLYVASLSTGDRRVYLGTYIARYADRLVLDHSAQPSADLPK